ncbi:MAG: 5-(carboxyamino)imidazole ribonucleotide mutase [Deltaproteobacteria bacterium CG11_big_fil_rev_8_21_14_0_20_45_16]|nr:MAG: 5-(carboxyamino)imidazole ribonucleotide mutase [Deltaproteobacteria bacterium CG11_big_fil_rev_8_21_14_0_20_45_16]
MTSAKNKKRAQVSIVMGSDSDWKIMKAATECLSEFSVPYEAKIVSAHRTPEKMSKFAKDAEARGIKLIIAGAGGAAHLPGMLASFSSLPVIGVPVNITKLDGKDSLLSILQMPKGVPVACVAIDGAYNAGILAIKILAFGGESTNKKLAKGLGRFRDQLRRQVEKKKLK